MRTVTLDGRYTDCGRELLSQNTKAREGDVRLIDGKLWACRYVCNWGLFWPDRHEKWSRVTREEIK